MSQSQAHVKSSLVTRFDRTWPFTFTFSQILDREDLNQVWHRAVIVQQKHGAKLPGEVGRWAGCAGTSHAQPQPCAANRRTGFHFLCHQVASHLRDKSWELKAVHKCPVLKEVDVPQNFAILKQSTRYIAFQAENNTCSYCNLSKRNQLWILRPRSCSAIMRRVDTSFPSAEAVDLFGHLNIQCIRISSSVIWLGELWTSRFWDQIFFAVINFIFSLLPQSI